MEPQREKEARSPRAVEAIQAPRAVGLLFTQGSGEVKAGLDECGRWEWNEKRSFEAGCA